MTVNVVAQTLSHLASSGCSLLYTEMIYWRLIIAVRIVCTTVQHRMTICIFPRRVSTECEQRIVIPIHQWTHWNVTLIQTGSIGGLCRSKGKWQASCCILQMSVNGGSTVLGLPSWIIMGLGNCIYLSSEYWWYLEATMLVTISWLPHKHDCQCCINNIWSCILRNSSAMHRQETIIQLLATFLGKMQVMISQPPSQNGGQQIVNIFWVGSVSCTATNRTAWFYNGVPNVQSLQFVFVFNFTNMHAMSHKSDFCLASNFKVDIYKPV